MSPRIFWISSLRLFLIPSLFPFISCIWLTSDTQQIPLKEKIFQSGESVVYKPILIRISDGDTQIVGDKIGSLDCMSENGRDKISAFDIYDRNEMFNGKPSDKLRTLIKNAVPNVLFKSDYCTTVETEEPVHLDDVRWKFQLDKYAEMQNKKPHLCQRIGKENSKNIIRSKFSETCVRIPKYELIVDISRKEAVLLAEGKIQFNIDHSNRSLGYGLGWMFNVFSLGFLSLNSSVSASSTFKNEPIGEDKYAAYVIRYRGGMEKSFWNYFIWPIWLFKPDERIRFGTPFSDPDDTIGLDDFTQESARQALVVDFLENRLTNRK
ncbi:hypothetical protein [Leptospira adleri]|uniref:Uncharacterized protein n=1 Tax=Leptospira adleri TaxID=2023186 RepID=A0A2M9YL68_9LEPT|nr:hypothetical protein [Leptospira adleri]PJZ52301.1 hypothetical protein CH380_15455 [Leptospira adleri]PJZ63508.1 hypothetical protein CH376_02475 [Leptospira adleri]